jgi:hypothetical protein
VGIDGVPGLSGAELMLPAQNPEALARTINSLRWEASKLEAQRVALEKKIAELATAEEADEKFCLYRDRLLALAERDEKLRALIAEAKNPPSK